MDADTRRWSSGCVVCPDVPWQHWIENETDSVRKQRADFVNMTSRAWCVRTHLTAVCSPAEAWEQEEIVDRRPSPR